MSRHDDQTATASGFTHAPGVIENFLLGLGVVWRELRRMAARLMRGYEYCRLGRIQAGHDTATSRALVMGQIGLLKEELDALDAE
jgi:hypothetical protein